MQVLFKMYGDGDGGGSRAGFVGRRGLMAFILDIIAASPPPLAPPDLAAVAAAAAGGGSKASRFSASSVSPQQQEEQEQGRAGAAIASGATPQPAVDLEQELEGVLSKMAGVVLAEVRKEGTHFFFRWPSREEGEGERETTVISSLVSSGLVWCASTIFSQLLPHGYWFCALAVIRRL